MSARILLVEDDPDLANIVVVNAAPYQLDVTVSADGHEGLRRALAEEFSMVILDVGLPSLNGLDVCRELREKRPLLPILFLTAQSTEADVAIGFEFGADDYVTKPFRPRELVSRVRAILNRYNRLTQRPREELPTVSAPVTEQQSPPLPPGTPSDSAPRESNVARFGDLQFDFDALRCFRGQTEVQLTAQEWAVTQLFIQNAGRAVARDVIIEDIWGGYAPQYEGLLNRLIYRLRAKLEENLERPLHLVAVRGIGYRWEV